MKTHHLLPLLAALLASPVVIAADPPQMPTPQKEHAWLQQLVGEWDWESEMWMAPGQPSMKMKGTETTRPIGGFWVINESKSEFMGQPFSGLFTLGFDPAKGKYVSTWVDSVSSYLWHHEGTVDAAGQALTLETEGPCPQKGGALTKFKEVLEIKDKDAKSFTSSVLEDDGKWRVQMKIEYRRKK